MKPSYNKEYHPVIEDYISEYAEGNLDTTEKTVFEEVLVYDDELRELANAARSGKSLIESFMQVKARDGFEERLAARILAEN